MIMLEFWLGAFILIGSLISIGSLIAGIGAETDKQWRICEVFAAGGLVVTIIAVIAVMLFY